MFSGFSKKINLDHLGELVRSDFTYPSAKPNKPGFWNYYPKIRYENILSDEALKFFTTIKAIPKEGCLLFRGFPNTYLNIHTDGGGENAWALNFRLTPTENVYMHWFEPLAIGKDRSVSPDNTELSVTNFTEYDPSEVKEIHKAKIEKSSLVKIGIPHTCSNEDKSDALLLSIRFWFIGNQKEFIKYIED